MFDSSESAAWLATALDVAVKAALILIAAGLIAACLRGAAAAKRHLVWTLAVVAVLLLPAISVWLPAWPVLPGGLPSEQLLAVDEAGWPAADGLGGGAPGDEAVWNPDVYLMHSGALAKSVAATKEAPDAVEYGAGEGVSAAGSVSGSVGEGGSAPEAWGWYDWLLAVWMAGVVVVLMPVMLGWLRVQHLRWRSRPLASDAWLAVLDETKARLGVDRAVLLHCSAENVMPMTWGVLPMRPAHVMLPANAETWSDDRRRLVLLHELGHVKRWDCATQLLAWLSCALYWFNPLAWYAARRMAVERERASDDLVLDSGASAADYAQELLEITADLPLRRFASCSSVAMARRSALGVRIRKILDPAQARAAIGWRSVSVSMALAIGLVVPMTMMTVRAAMDDGLAGMPPEQAVVYNTDRLWRSSTWAGSNHTSQARLDQSGESPVFHVYEPKRRHVWLGYPDLHVDADRYPIVVMEYRASGLNPENDNYVIWLDDGTGPNYGGIRIFRTDELVMDGSLQEIRRDLRTFDPVDAINGLAFGVTAGPEGGARFEMVSLRFERDPDDATEHEALADGEPIAVRVVDETGEPVAGATVAVDATTLNYARSARTDEQGLAEVTPLDHGQSHMVRVDAEGMARIELTGVELGRAEPIEVVMHEARRYGGVVRNEQGQPIARAGVSLLLSQDGVTPPAGAERVRMLSSVSVVADEQGRWQTPPTYADRFSARLSHPDYVMDMNYREVEVRDMAQRDEADGRAALVMQRGREVSGVVVNHEGEPIADARLAIGSVRFNTTQQTTRADDDGRFQFPATAVEGALLLTADADEEAYAPMMLQVPREDDWHDLRIVMEPGHRLHGRVLDTAGRPLADVRISANTWRGGRSLRMATHTDEEGRFEFLNAPPDEVGLDFAARGMMTLRNRLMTARDEPYEITLRQPLTIRGQVTDAETGEPIEAFTVIPGIVFAVDAEGQPTQPPSWQRHPNAVRRGEAGRYEIVERFPREGHMVRIEAAGYLPGVSRVFEAEEGEVRYDFELEPAEGIEGEVRNSDGEPVRGAEVAVIDAERSFVISNGQLNRHQSLVTAQTDEEGRFELWPTEHDAVRLVVLHEQGFAESLVPVGEIREKTIELRPWGRLEGQLTLRDQPARGEQITASLMVQPEQRQQDASHARIHYSWNARTDEAGRFAFDRVVPGEIQVSRTFPTISRGGMRHQAYSHTARLDVQPGETATVQLGGRGRPVVGRLVLADDGERDVDWNLVIGHLRTSIDPVRPPLPDNWETMEMEERQAWHTQWLETEEGQAFHAAEQARMREMRTFGFGVERDGRFRLEDVPEGKYTLNATLYDEPNEGSHTVGEPIGRVSREVVIEPIDGGYTTDPLDMGDVEVTPQRTLAAGDLVPDFEVDDLFGGVIRLSDYEGQFVLLDFWATWCGPCIAEKPNLKRVYDAFGDDDRFELIAISLDQDMDAPRRYVEANEFEWVQGHVRPDIAAAVAGQYGVRGIPQIMLIDPEGKLVARNLRGERIFEAVEAALRDHESARQ